MIDQGWDRCSDVSNEIEVNFQSQLDGLLRTIVGRDDARYISRRPNYNRSLNRTFGSIPLFSHDFLFNSFKSLEKHPVDERAAKERNATAGRRGGGGGGLDRSFAIGKRTVHRGRAERAR